jgi:di/tricarboxylate transporter
MACFHQERALTVDQFAVLAVLVATMGLFLWGRWRHDMVAIAALIAVVVLGLVPPEAAFDGFGHPAVITVACILILSRGLQNSGAVDLLARRVLPAEAGALTTITALTALATVLSGFMNNVGALALLMPLAIQIAARLELPPGQVLMPLSFGSILGGMTTLIGTPPNLVVAGFRAETTGEPFGMFAFTPVGLAVALAGVLFICTIGRFLIPVRERATGEGFEIGAYLTEARIGNDSPVRDKSLREVEAALGAADAQVIGLVRDEIRLPGPHPSRRVHEGDILVIEADPEALAKALSTLDLKLVEDQPEAAKNKEPGEGEPNEADDEAAAMEAEIETVAAGRAVTAESGSLATERQAADGDKDGKKAKGGKERSPDEEEVILMEFAVLPDAAVIGRSANEMRLRTRFGVNLLAVSRQGRRTISRLRSMSIRSGDVLLLQGSADALGEFGGHFGCVPLAERPLRLPNRRAAYTAAGIMGVAILATSLGLLPSAVAFAGAVLAAMVTRVVPPRNAYDAVDWPVIVLLAALLAVASAMEETGTADLVANFLLATVAQGNPLYALIVLLVATMLLTDFMNNAATVAVLCPIALSAANSLGVNPDAFLMAVAVGGSCAFLTPIGHQNNTLILGPGGFRFGDYWRLGVPLQLVIVTVSVPMILWIWPL